jgi:hypothetical protein
MAGLDATVQVHLHIDVNGESITHVFSQPASMEPLSDTPQGLAVHRISMR